MPKVKVEKIKVGDYVCTPGDRKVRWVCGIVDKIERSSGLVVFRSRGWASESARKYSDDPMGSYIARRGETLMVKPKPK